MSLDARLNSIEVEEVDRPARPDLKDDEEDLEAQDRKSSETVVEEKELDIEHLPVPDDPRAWSSAKKNFVLFSVSICSVCATLGANIYFPAIANLQKDLDASDSDISLSVSLFIVTQGVFPLIWSSISELKGRKKIYLSSMLVYIVGAIVAARCTSISVFIGMRILQAIGGSSVLSLGAGTLSDIYDTHERGAKVGIYYMSPLLGQSLGPLIGGAVTKASDWRATFYLIVAYAGLCVLILLFFPETFRKERSAAWRAALKRAIASAESEADTKAKERREEDVEKGERIGRKLTIVSLGGSVLRVPTKDGEGEGVKVKISWRDLNPLSATGTVLKQLHNIVAIAFSGLLFGAQYSIFFTAARDFAKTPYNYSSLEVGLVLLSFGVGNIIGSILGGKYSDIVLARLKRKNNGVERPEMRIRSTTIALIFWPPSVLAYAWAVDRTVDIWWCCIILVVGGFSCIWAYTSILAYIVDKNKGRASSAVACNSLFRGVFAMVASETALPLQKAIGNGWLYTIWFALTLLGEISVVWIGWMEDRRIQWKFWTPRTDASQ
ncbi:MFS general substrate transporter [Atractiella rhizophila]|nr:MFS general substrate transporter [Atractiella rhizophila]